MSDEPSPPRPAGGESALPAEIGDDGGYRVKLPDFEGPLDLLLHLIQEHQLNVLDIPIGFVTSKYVEYITLMQELNIDLASEYLVMAATLTHIKSKMLLPTPPQDQEEDLAEELDPRAELVRRLLEYQKYKQAAEQLGGRSVLGRDVFVRGLPAPSVDGPAPLAPIGLFKLLDAFQSVLSRAKTTVDHQIDFEQFSITDRINQLVDVLRAKKKLLFAELFEGQEQRSELIVTFLAILEMTRLRMTRISQDEPLAPIFVELAVSDEDVDELTQATLGALQETTVESGRGDAAPGEPSADGPSGAESSAGAEDPFEPAEAAAGVPDEGQADEVDDPSEIGSIDATNGDEEAGEGQESASETTADP
ncbi:MAG TPA: segregation/condensation protein A [Polyangiaceae bacterium]